MDQHDLPAFHPQPYKISTITATGGISSNINLQTLYDKIELVDFNNDEEGFVYIEYGQKKCESVCRGYHKKLDITRRKKKDCKRFDNQATVILKKRDQCVNMKVFKNGNIQMTGLKYIDQGKEAIDKLINVIKTISLKDPSVVDHDSTIEQKEYKIRLINSDFRVGFEVKRDKLCKVIQMEYNVFCSFEPCIYPGVKVQYNWNKNHQCSDGVCRCIAPCNGKGTGCGDGNCKKITIAVFQSGCIIITGAQTHEQINDAYSFICNIVKNHLTTLYKRPLNPLNETKNS